MSPVTSSEYPTRTVEQLLRGSLCYPACGTDTLPGHGFGNNWTNFFSHDGHLAQIVKANPAGMPEILVQGGMGERSWFRDSHWPEYPHFINAIAGKGKRYVGVWTR